MKKRITAVLLCVVMLLSLAACGANTPDDSGADTGVAAAADTKTDAKEEAKTEDKTAPAANVKTASGNADELIIATSADFFSTDPQDCTTADEQAYLSNIYETLFERDSDGSFHEALCESYEWEDNQTLLLHIRQGVKWHDGTELTAEDVMFTFNRYKDFSSLGTVQQNIDYDKTEQVDDYTVRLVLVQPNSAMLQNLEYLPGAIVCKHTVESYKDETGWLTNVNGTGAYKVKEIAPGEKMVLEANPDYWRGEPTIKKITLKPILDSTMRALSLQSGDVDGALAIAAADIETLSAVSDINVCKGVGTNTRFVVFGGKNLDKYTYEVKKAFAYATDGDNAFKNAWYGTGSRCKSWFASTFDYYKEFDWPYDPEKAMELLAEAGYPDGIDVEILCMSDSSNAGTAEILQAQWAKAGIRAEIKRCDAATFNELTNVGNFDIAFAGHTTATLEPDRALRRYDSRNANFEMYGWHNDEFNQILDDAVASTDDAEKKELYERAQQILYDNCVSVPIMTRDNISAAKTYIKGWELIPSMGQTRFRNLSIGE